MFASSPERNVMIITVYSGFLHWCDSFYLTGENPFHTFFTVLAKMLDILVIKTKFILYINFLNIFIVYVVSPMMWSEDNFQYIGTETKNTYRRLLEIFQKADATRNQRTYWFHIRMWLDTLVLRLNSIWEPQIREHLKTI